MKRVSIFDFTFTVSDSADEIATDVVNFDSALHSGSPFLITPNVDDIVNWDKAKYQDLKSEFRRSAFIIPDGQPLVTFSKLIRKSLIKRQTGSTLFPFIWKKLKAKNKKVVLILANDKLCGFYEREYANAKTYAPPIFKETDSLMISEIVKQCKGIIERHEPSHVFVGIQFPKQNILALELYKILEVSKMPLFLILGSSMEYYSGHLKRSPQFFQSIGMEWFYRLCQQPGRLFRRYFINDLPIVGIFFRELFKVKTNGKLQ